MRKKKRSPYLLEKPFGTLPKRELSLHVKELFKRSDRAIQKLKRMLDE